jgi:hypothetical protein
LGLDEDAIEALVECGLRDRFPEECNTWAEQKTEVSRKLKADIEKAEADTKLKLSDESAQLEELLREAIVATMVTEFPCVADAVSTVAVILRSFSRTLSRQSLGFPSAREGSGHDAAKAAGARNYISLL